MFKLNENGYITSMSDTIIYENNEDYDEYGIGPYHKINPAIRSRCQIFELHELDTNDIIEALNKVPKTDYLKDIKINKKAIEYIANLSSGDLRYAYNLLEMAYYSTSDFNVTIDVIKNINSKCIAGLW